MTLDNAAARSSSRSQRPSASSPQESPQPQPSPMEILGMASLSARSDNTTITNTNPTISCPNETEKFAARAERALKHASGKEDPAISISMSVSAAAAGSARARLSTNSQSSNKCQSPSLQKLNVGKDNEVEFVGREKEVAALGEAIDKLMSNNLGASDNNSPIGPPPRVVSICGAPGTGKSRLAQQMRSRVIERDGYFVTGKMDQQNRGDNGGPAQAYSGLATAMHHLAEQILARDFDMGIRRRLSETIGGTEDASVLVEIFPALSTILYAAEDVPGQQQQPKQRQTSIRAAQRGNTRRFLFQQFIRVLLTSHRNYQDEDMMSDQDDNVVKLKEDEDPVPLVLVLDDLQWIDTPSLDLISSLVRDRNLEKFLLITTSRPLHEEQDHPFTKQRQMWKAQRIPEESYHLENLNPYDTNAILSSLLDTTDDRESNFELAALIHQKTGGNAFFAIQYIQALVDQDLLTYSFGGMKWKYDIQKVQSLVLDGGDSAVGLLTIKLKRLPPNKQLILVVAACLGATFSDELLANLIQAVDANEILVLDKKRRQDEQSRQIDTNTHLSFFVELGFLGRIGDSYFFSHDLIKQTAMTFVSHDKSLVLKLRIGELVLEGFKESRNKQEDIGDALLFLGVDLCNGTARLGGQQHRMQMKLVDLAKNNLLAGEKAMRDSAFALSLQYMDIGLRLLKEEVQDEGGNETHRDLNIKLLAGAAEASYCVGNLEDMDQYADRLLQQQTCPEEVRFRMLHFKILSKTAQDQFTESCEVGRSAIQLLGMANFPKRPGGLYVIRELIKTRRALRHHTKETLLALPVLTDGKRIAALKFFDAIIPCSYVANLNFFLVTQLKSIRWALKYGISKYTPTGFALYGVILLCSFGDVPKGVMFGEVALALSERLGVKESIAKASMTVFSVIHHWTNDLRSCHPPIVYSYRLAMECGDTESALLCLMYMDHITWCSALAPLHVFAEDLERHCALCHEHKHGSLLNAISVLARGLRRLCSNEMAFQWLDDYAGSQAKNSKPEKKRDLPVQYFSDLMALQSHYLLGEKGEALKHAKATGDIARVCLGQIFVPRAQFYRALVLLSFASEGNAVLKNLREAKRTLTMLKTYADNGNMNCLHMVCLLEAESAKIRKDETTAKQKYADAITMATRSGHTHDAGTCHECAGVFFLVERKDHTRASFHIEQAIKCFRDWGAGAVVQRLNNSHAALISDYSVAFPTRE